jgi:hypothetical protein
MRVLREAQEIGLDAARGGVSAGVGVDGEEQVGGAGVGDGRALLERHEDVRGPRHHHLGAQVFANHLLEPQRDVEDEVLLHEPAAADGAGVVSAVTGIDHDPACAEAQLSRQAERPVPVRFR